MDKEEILFKKIAEKLSSENKLVSTGKMLSSPGIKYRNKVFAFYYGKEMVFRLGKTFDPKTFGIRNYRLLNPFKKKPPLAGWFQISFSEKQKWGKLSRIALRLISEDT